MGNRVLRLRKEDAVLVGIDFQERIMPAMKDSGEMEAASVKLIKGCRVLGVPVLVTQQYTKGLGPTVPAVTAALTDPIGEDVKAEEFRHIEKTSFSAM